MQTFGGHTDVCMEWTYRGCFKELQFLYRRIVMKNNNKVIFIEDQKKTVRGEKLGMNIVISSEWWMSGVTEWSEKAFCCEEYL